MKTKSSFIRNLMSRSPLRRGFILIVLVLGCFALSPMAQAVCQDACLANFNTVQGDDALISLTTGTSNTANGYRALFGNTTGERNTATGYQALLSNTTGNANTANGFEALFSNTNGFANTATGLLALFSNTTGGSNTATGYQALVNNTTGRDNTATGVAGLFFNTTGNENTANGAGALASNTTGGNNTANGFEALFSNTTGNFNTATGAGALASNTTGGNNTANGGDALSNSTTGNNNTATGVGALFSNTTGGNNIALGNGAGANLTTGDNNIDIANAGVAAEANTIRIGTVGTQRKAFIAGINGAAVMGAAVKVNAAGQLGTAPSSVRYKQDIKPMDKSSEAIHALKPVTFRYKKEIDPEGTPEFGLVAEEVAKVNPDLVVRDAKGEVYTVRYEAVNAMLLNEFLKEHRKVQELEANAVEQQKDIKSLVATVKAQAEQIQKVSAQLEVSKPTPKTVLNNQSSHRATSRAAD
jgi:trimeric autotransporter adhesin